MYINCNSSPEVQSAIDVYNDFCNFLVDVPYILAGGAPRDIFFNRVPSDYDIYIPIEYAETLISDNNELHSYFTNSYPDNYSHDYIEYVVNYLYKEKRFQIIFVSKSFETVVNSFSCSLSMITYKDGLLLPLKPFIDSWKYGHITFSSNVRVQYLAKICSKFYTYTYSKGVIR